MESKSNQANCCDCSRMSPVFKHLTNDELKIVNDSRIKVTYKAGENIVKQGAPLTHVISFTSGIAKVYIEGKNNKNHILHFLRPTEFLGGPGIYVDNKHHFSVTAIEDSTVCFIDIDAFKKIIKQNCDFADSFMQYISKNGIFNYEKFISLTQKNMHGRIADALIYLHNEIYFERDYNITISRQDLADFSGMSKDSAIRILKEFEKEKVVTLKNKVVKISDMNKLFHFSETS